MPAGGGIIQIAALGRQNDYINKNPNFTLFKTSHNKYTSFAEDFEYQDMNGVIAFGAQKAPATISRYGDLITDVHLYVTLPPIDAPQDGDWNKFEQTPASGVLGQPGYVPPVYGYYPKGAYWVNAIGYALIDEVSLEIGSQDIDTLYSDYLFMWEELTQRPGARIMEAIGKQQFSEDVESYMIQYSAQQRELFVQIPFFFNKYFLEKGLALPLISLTYHEIKIKISFAKIEDVCCVVVQHPDHPAYDPNRTEKWLLIEQNLSYPDAPAADIAAGTALPGRGLSRVSPIPINKNTSNTLQTTELVAKLLVTYIYLDVEERNTFSQSDHEMLITTLQRQQNSIATAGLPQDSLKLYFNHPSNFILWAVRPHNYKTNGGRRRYSVGHKDRFDFTAKVPNPNLDWGDIVDPITNATLKLNSHERWPENMSSQFFRTIQPQLKFENSPTAYLYVFCFSAAGGVWNPTSTLNFSRIEHTQLDLKYNNIVGAEPSPAQLLTTNSNVSGKIQPSDIIMYVESYNLLVVKNGMGGLRFSN